MNRSSLALAALATLVLLPLHAGATVIKYAFSGRVSLVQNLGAAVSVGDSFSASLTFDTAQATGTDFGTQQDFDFPSPGAYALEVNLAGYSGSGTDGQISILNNFGGGPQDWFQTLSGVGNGFSGAAIDGLTWTQTTLTLKDYQADLYSDTSLPDRLAELNAFEEAFATMFFDPSGQNGLVNATIHSIKAVASKAQKTTLEGATEKKKVLATDDSSGEVLLTLPGESTDTFSATYSQQAKEELNLNEWDFIIPGDIFQIWDLHYDGTLGEGEFAEIVLTYDDTGMSLFEELALDILHEVSGKYIALGGVVDVDRNTITALTPGFSNFFAGIPVPVPGTWMLAGTGLLCLAMSTRRRRIKGHAGV